MKHKPAPGPSVLEMLQRPPAARQLEPQQPEVGGSEGVQDLELGGPARLCQLGLGGAEEQPEGPAILQPPEEGEGGRGGSSVDGQPQGLDGPPVVGPAEAALPEEVALREEPPDPEPYK
eukprot:15438497-Alexandrium_andersonii.AAC.1